MDQPQTLGIRPTFGFGDRIGLAGAGHLRACRRGPYLPILAQQSIRELYRTERTPEDVMEAARTALQTESWEGDWGADADHLKTKEDVVLMAKAGWTFFTIDPSHYVNNAADRLRGSELLAAAGDIEEFVGLYLDTELDVGTGIPVKFQNSTELIRSLAKYREAIDYTVQMAEWIAEFAEEGTWEIEVSVDETDLPTSPEDHWLFANELKRRGVKIVSLAPRFVGEFEKGIDFRGDVTAFEAQLKQHAGIAKQLGPYKLSIHSGSDKFSVYPILGRVCGDLLHVKTAGTSYLEALRCIGRVDKSLLLKIAIRSIQVFEQAKATYQISGKVSDLGDFMRHDQAELEDVLLNQDSGRQVLHVAYGTILTDSVLKPKLLEALAKNADLHSDLVEAHLGKHIDLLQAG